MRQDEMIKLAREAGFDDDNQFTIYNIERFAALVAAHEREACAKVCDEEIDDWDYESVVNAALNNCATAIRARGEK